MQIPSSLSTHTSFVTTNTRCQGRLRAGQFLLNLRLRSTDLIVDAIFLVVSKFPGLVEL
jgi:hypothetical protein